MDTDNNQFPIGRVDYEEILRQAVAVIEHARLAIAKHVNTNVASAYWEIGKMLHDKKIESGYGEGVVKRLSIDLKERFPKMGLSTRQLWNMKKFYLRYVGHDEKLLQAVAVLPWGHNLLLMDKELDDVATLYYAQETIAKGWSRSLLLNAVKMNMYEAQAVSKVDNNFSRTLPMVKPIGVADYQLIVPKEKLQKVLTDEIKAFSEEKENKKEESNEIE